VRSSVVILSSADQSRSGSERRFAQTIMKASRSSSSHSPRTSASSTVLAHARPLLVAYPIRAPPLGAASPRNTSSAGSHAS
jgi:hypothetical protein